MKRKRTRRTTDISMEVKEVLLVTGARDGAETWCPQCALRVSTLTPDEVATALGIDRRTVLGRVDDGTLHSTATEHGLRICVRSLAALRPEASHSCGIAAAPHDEDP